MYKKPSARQKKKKKSSVSIVPLLDVVFILIFFLLFSAEFVKYLSIHTDLKINTVVVDEKKDTKPPLLLTVKFLNSKLNLMAGENRDIKQSFSFESETQFPFDDFHKALVQIKKEYPKESSIILLPMESTSYDFLVKIMDQARFYNRQDIEKGALFDQILFENLEGTPSEV